MLELKHINKKYNKTLVLKDINISFRKKEFVSILGESGSGKSTLLNILSTLDNYTSGELLINGIDTKYYKERDYDNYRKYQIGFVFQNYNLINHLTILENINLVTNNSKKSLEALEKVGLLEHKNKQPLELSGGERQRVAIARALIKNPNILFLDEPTGALDSKTSIEIMELIKKIGENKLVIMVTHNKEIATKYSNRIITLKDGKIINDTNPYCSNNQYKKYTYKNNTTSLKNYLKLSINNLKQKKKRTILVSLAASIGIIGISLILSLSNGVQEYITKTEQETFSNYPIEINKTNMDYSNITLEKENVNCKKGTICSEDDISNSNEVIDQLSIKENNLKEFKNYLETNKKIEDYTTSIEYIYDIDLQIYSDNIRINPPRLKVTNSLILEENNKLFQELVSNKKILNNKYKILKGRMPNNYNELVLVVNKDNIINMSTLYNLNIEPLEELNNSISNHDLNLKSKQYNYEDLIGKEYKLLLNTDYYIKENNWIDKRNDINYVNKLLNNALTLKIVGVIKEKEGTNSYIGFNHELIEYVINKNKESEVYNDLKEDKERLKDLGITDINEPISIKLYPNSYNNKEKINKYIEKYNKEHKDKISYTDIIGVLLSTINSIVKIISFVLIALVAISLIVSSIMISIITYISVLERTKEIGILRSIGYSKKDIKRIFKIEKIIEGLLAGIIGISISRLLIIPINIIIESLTNISNIAKMNYNNMLILLLISIIITIASGSKPAKKASNMSMVEAIRNE